MKLKKMSRLKILKALENTTITTWVKLQIQEINQRPFEIFRGYNNLTYGPRNVSLFLEHIFRKQ